MISSTNVEQRHRHRGQTMKKKYFLEFHVVLFVTNTLYSIEYSIIFTNASLIFIENIIDNVRVYVCKQHLDNNRYKSMI